MDIAVGGYMIWGALYGLRRGMLFVVFSLLGYIAGVEVATHSQHRLTNLVLSDASVKHWLGRLAATPAMALPGSRIQATQWIDGLVGLLVFLMIIGIAELIGRMVGGVFTRMVGVFRITGALNRVGGLLAGVAEHAVVAGLLLSLMLSVPVLSHHFGHTIHRAPLAGMVLGWFGHIARIPGGKFL